VDVNRKWVLRYFLGIEMDIMNNESACDVRNIVRWTGMGVTFALFLILVSWNFALTI